MDAVSLTFCDRTLPKARVRVTLLFFRLALSRPINLKKSFKYGQIIFSSITFTCIDVGVI